MEATTAERVSFAPFTDTQLIVFLHVEEDRLPRELVDEFLTRGERMIWRLTDLCREERSWTQGGAKGWAPIHATFILGAFEDSRALMGLLAALRWSTRHGIDWVYENLPPILGRLGRAAIAPLKARAADVEAGELDRMTELHCLAAIAARHPIHQGEILDFMRSLADNSSEQDYVRAVAASILLKFARPGDRKSILTAAIRQQWGERPPLFDADDIEAAYGRGEPRIAEYQRDWLDFYAPEAIEARQRRWAEELEDARWASGVEEDSLWVEEQRHRFLTKYEFSLLDLDDEDRGDALWVAESMTEYLVWYEGLAPWSWNGSTAFSYLMDLFARRVALDDAGRIDAVPDGVLRFVGFCAERGLVSAEDLKAVEACVEAERFEFVETALDPERRQVARAILEQMMANGVDPRDPAAPPLPKAAALARDRKTSRRYRRK